MTATTQPAPETLSRRFKTLYSLGDLGISMPQAVLAFFQLYFLTDIAGLRPDYAAWAVIAGKLWDAVNDPLFGIISDRIRSKHGRRRVLLLYGAVPLGIAFMLMFIAPDLSQAGLAIFYSLTFMLYDTCLTAVQVGLNALTPELTADYDERSSLNGYRMFFAITGSLGAIIFATLLSDLIKDPRTLYMVLGFGLGLVSIIPPLIVFAVTKNYRSNAPEGETLSPKNSILITIKNRPFQKVMGLYLFSWTTVSVMAAGLLYFANYYLRAPDHANYLVLVAQTSAIAFVPVSVWLAKKYDKRMAFIIGCVSWLVVLFVFFFISPDQLGMVYGLAALLGLGIATAYVIPWSMIPDIIEYDELKTGERREGSFYAFASFFQKLGTGLAIWGMGQALAMTGYVTPDISGTFPIQPDAAILAIRIFMGLAPAVLLVVAILFAWRYPISREYHQDLLDQLANQD